MVRCGNRRNIDSVHSRAALRGKRRGKGRIEAALTMGGSTETRKQRRPRIWRRLAIVHGGDEGGLGVSRTNRGEEEDAGGVSMP
jgi:hypothetical protein